MFNDQWLFRGKLALAVMLAGSVYGFFYFEGSALLRALIIFISLFGLTKIFLQPRLDKPATTSRGEVLVLLILYLGFFALYNMLYGLGIPLYVVMVAVWLIVATLFTGVMMVDRFDLALTQPNFWFLVSLVGLSTLELFLSLTFWPIDPSLKSLFLVVFFYLGTNVIYLHIHNVLRFKKMLGYSIISLIILSLLIANIWLSLRSGL